jgi:hypothetical protein
MNVLTPLSTAVAARYSWNSYIGLHVNLTNGLVTDNYGTDKRTWSPQKAFLLAAYLKFCSYLKMNTANVEAEM